MKLHVDAIHAAILFFLFFVNSGLQVFGENLLQNSGLEEGDTSPAQWSPISYEPGPIFAIERKNPHSGNNCVSIENKALNDARFVQYVKVTNNASYKLSGWIRTENVSFDGGGAIISLNDYFDASAPIKGTNDKWQYVEFYVAVESGIDQLGIALRLGNFANVCTGKAYFDDVSMELVKEIPGGKINYKVGKIVETNQNPVLQPEPESNGNNTSIPIRTLLTIIFVILGAIIFSYNLIMKKPPHDKN